MRLTRVFAAIAICAIALIAAQQTFLHHMPQPSQQSAQSSIIVPLYSDPSQQWDRLAEISRQSEWVRFYVVVNPDNGPGQAFSANYSRAIASLERAGITVLGYVHTAWGSRPLPEVEDEIQRYVAWYNLSAIFLDEVADSAPKEAYYSEIVNHSRAIGVRFFVGNPGTFVPKGYLQIFNLTIIYEDLGYPSPQQIASYADGLSRNRLGIIVYGVGWDAATIKELAKHVGALYVTSYGPPDPYQNLSQYVSELAQALRGSS